MPINKIQYSLLGVMVLVFVVVHEKTLVKAGSQNDPLIDAALDAVESSAISAEQDAFCVWQGVSVSVATSQGSFGLCSADFQAAVKFFAVNGRSVTLAYFQDDEYSLFDTNKIGNGNVCDQVYNKVGRSCFAAGMSVTARSFMPFWKNTANITASTVARFIQNTFSPQLAPYPGTTGRCYPNSGKFQIVGLSGPHAQNALSIRKSVYDGCEIIKGDARFWASISWSYQRIGSLLIGIGSFLIMIFVPCLSCCL